MKNSTSKMIAAGLCAATVFSSAFAQVPPVISNDDPHQIVIGIHKIDEAYNHLAGAGGDWNGHREAAMQHLQEAKRDLQMALDFYNKGR